MGKGLDLDMERKPHFPFPVPSAEGHRPDLLFKVLEGGGDLHDLVTWWVLPPLAGCDLEASAPAGTAVRGIACKATTYRDNSWGWGPPSVVPKAFAFESLGCVHGGALEAVLRGSELGWH